MLDLWREQVTSEKAHFRELSGLPGTGHNGELPIETHTARIRASIKAKPIGGVRSPPGSGYMVVVVHRPPPLVVWNVGSPFACGCGALWWYAHTVSTHAGPNTV